MTWMPYWLRKENVISDNRYLSGVPDSNSRLLLILCLNLLALHNRRADLISTRDLILMHEENKYQELQAERSLIEPYKTFSYNLFSKLTE